MKPKTKTVFNITGGVTPYTKDKTLFFKALLPFLIILHHFSQCTGACPFFVYMGPSIVACFFLMSGYGLMTSYLKKPNAYLEHFLFHRFTTLFIPYFVTFPLCVAATMFVKHYSVCDYFAKKDFDQYVPNTWFIWVLAGGYIAFRIIFGWSNISIRMKLWLFAFVSFSYYAICMIYGASQYWYISSIGILLGMVWRYKEKAIIKLAENHILLIPILAIVLSLVPKILFNKGDLVFPICSCLLFIWVAYFYKARWANNKLTHFLSNISYELYLCHGLIIGTISHLTDYAILNFIFLVIASIMLAICINKVSNLLSSLLSR